MLHKNQLFPISHILQIIVRPRNRAGTKTPMPRPVAMLQLEEISGQRLGKTPGGGGYSSEFLVGVCRPGLQIPTLFQT